MEQASFWGALLSVVFFVWATVLAVRYFLREIGVSKQPESYSPQVQRILRPLSTIAQKVSRFFSDIREQTGLANRLRRKETSATHRSAQGRLFLVILGWVIVSRVLIAVVAYMGLMLLKNESGGFWQSLSWMWSKWDAGHFLSVAEHGYQSQSEEKYFIVFYPLYPLLVRTIARGIHSFEYAGILVSNLSLAIAATYLYRLVRLDFNHAVASQAVAALLTFPVSFFLGIVYSDSLFLALSILTFYYLRTNRWPHAGIWGFLAALTRNFGVLLFLPALIEWIIGSGLVTSLRRKDWAKIRFHLGQGCVLLLIPLGFAVYLLINRVVTGNWFAFLIYQREHWSNGFGFFATNIGNYVHNALSWKPSERVSLWIPEVVAIFFTMGLILYGFAKIRLSYLIYMIVYLLICVSATWLISGPRYMMGLFPVYILLALLTRNKTRNIVWMSLSVSLSVFFVIAFVADYYLF